MAIAARRTDHLAALKDELEADGTTVHLLTLDVTDEQASRNAVQATVDALGRLDVLVSNAGLMLLGSVLGRGPSGRQGSSRPTRFDLPLTTRRYALFLLSYAHSRGSSHAC